MSLTYIQKKTEKLSAALHLVTDYIDVREPISRLLRQRSLELISLASGREISRHQVKDRISEVLSLLAVAGQSGFVSEMNYNLLKREYEELAFFLENPDSLLPEEPISGRDLAVPRQVSARPHAPVSGVRKPIAMRLPSAKSSESPAIRRGSRQERILEVLKTKKQVTVKDVAEVVTDCSEKTIQRELASLVQSGVLNKEGERRWSTYSLVQES